MPEVRKPYCKPNSDVLALVLLFMTRAVDAGTFSMLDPRDDRAGIALCVLAKLLGFPTDPVRINALSSSPDMVAWAYLAADYHEEAMLERALGVGHFEETGTADAE